MPDNSDGGQTDEDRARHYPGLSKHIADALMEATDNATRATREAANVAGRIVGLAWTIGGCATAICQSLAEIRDRFPEPEAPDKEREMDEAWSAWREWVAQRGRDRLPEPGKVDEAEAKHAVMMKALRNLCGDMEDSNHQHITHDFWMRLDTILECNDA